MHRKSKQAMGGSITVFLSLILILILSLLLTIIEGARINTAKTYAERALSTGMDSVLAEYYAPLWNEYHLFGLDTGYGTKTADNEQTLLKLKDYMSYTFHPSGDKDSFSSKEGIELYGITPQNLSLTNSTMLMDYEGKLFVNEAVDYMKYEDLSDAAELLMGKLSMLESPKKVSYLYEEKQKVSEDLVEIDEGILKLMELLDGVKTSKKGISTNKNHSLKTVTYFVKKICSGELTKEDRGINQESVFSALKDNYTNPFSELNKIEENFSKVKELIKKIEAAKKSSEETASAIEGACKSLSGISGNSKEAQKAAQQIGAYIGALQQQLASLQITIEQYEQEKEKCIEEIMSAKEGLVKLSSEIKPKIEEAISVIDKILSNTGKADKLIKGYEEKLYDEKDGLDENVFSGLEEDLKSLKRYTSQDTGGYHFSEMKNILTKDIEVLNQTQMTLNQGGKFLKEDNYSSSQECFIEADNILKTYQTEGLKLDYSTLVLTKDEDNNPLDKINSCLQDGLISLVLDPKTISECSLTSEALPSQIHALEKEETAPFDFISFFMKSSIGNKDTGAKEYFESAGAESGAVSITGKEINWLAESLLFQEYLKEHFVTYLKEGENLKSRKPSALTYEQEYLLFGKQSDKENLSSVITRIVLLRSASDFVCLLKDRAKCGEAKLAAASLVGFTGLPILVGITQAIILLIWAFAEALVDTCALLQGKEVEIFKKNIILNFTDLFLLNRTFIQKKASQMSKLSQTGKSDLLSMSFQDYIKIFLLFKKKETLAYRSMDLIQENLRLRYDENFSFQNCLFGFKVSSDFIMKPKFIAFPFMEKYTGKVKGYVYHTEASYSY